MMLGELATGQVVERLWLEGLLAMNASEKLVRHVWMNVSSHVVREREGTLVKSPVQISTKRNSIAG